MLLKNYWHFSFTVADLDRSLAFYVGALGMELAGQGEGYGPHLSRLLGYPDAHVKQATLRIPAMNQAPSGHLLALVQYLHPTGAPIDPANYQPGTAHLALQVENLVSEHARLSNLGVRFCSEPLTIPAGIWKGGKIVYLWDPDDIALEMVELPEPRSASNALL